MKKWTVGIFPAILLFGCASIERDHKAEMVGISPQGQAVASDLEVSWELHNDLSSEYFGYFNFTIINHSDKWHALTDMRIRFPDSMQNNRVRIVMGRDLKEWYAAKKRSMDVSEFNQATSALMAAGIGAGLATLSRNDGVQAAGVLLSAGTVGYLAADAFAEVKDTLRSAAMIPENHLLADTTWIPPGLFTDRWVLLNSTDHAAMGFVNAFTLEYRLEDGTACSNQIVLRAAKSGLGSRKWQADYFRKHLAPKWVNEMRKPW